MSCSSYNMDGLTKISRKRAEAPANEAQRWDELWESRKGLCRDWAAAQL